jgi:AcrR family transcriptional regulator
MAVTRGRGKAPRRRRTAEQARREILDAAEAQLAKGGPDSIRLQDVARAVGVSHPTVLHHFGSRDELVRAVVQRAFETLQGELVGAFHMTEIGEKETVAMLERVHQTLAQRGFGRLFAWLLLSGDVPAPDPALSHIRLVAEAAHAHRRRRWAGKSPPFEDTLFITMLTALAMLGDALAGETVRMSGGLAEDRAAAQRFRRWLAKLIVAHAEPPSQERGKRAY